MFSAPPTPTSTIAIVEPVFRVPPPVHVTVVLAATVMPLTVVDAPVIALLALKAIVVPLDQTVVNGPVGEVPQFVAVRVALVPLVFQ
jgi:hypothetical protein